MFMMMILSMRIISTYVENTFKLSALPIVVVRIISTYVENTNTMPLIETMTQDHLHIRGEYCRENMLTALKRGIISTYVENTSLL